METAQLLLRGAGGLVAVLGTVWVCVRVVNARNGAAARVPLARLRVLARTSVGRHASVVTVDVGDRVLVLGVGEQGVRLLAEQPALPPTEPSAERVALDVDVTGLEAGDPATPPVAAAVAAATGTPAAGAAAAGAAAAAGTAVPAPRAGTSGSLVDPGTWAQVVTVAREWTVRR